MFKTKFPKNFQGILDKIFGKLPMIFTQIDAFGFPVTSFDTTVSNTTVFCKDLLKTIYEVRYVCLKSNTAFGGPKALGSNCEFHSGYTIISNNGLLVGI